MNLDGRPGTFRDDQAAPSSMDLSQVRAGWFPVVVRWNTPRSPYAPVHLHADGSITFTRNGCIIQYQWARNQIPLAALQSEEQFPLVLPGFIDPDTAWGAPLPEASAKIEPDDAGEQHLVIESSNPEQFPRRTSAPIAIQPGAMYIMAGRRYSPSVQSCLGWEFLGRDYYPVTAQHYALGAADDWTWTACYATPQYEWTAIQLVAGVKKSKGKAEFDRLVLMRIQPPESELK